MEPLIFQEFEQMLKDHGLITRNENFGHWYQREYAYAHQLLNMYQTHVDRWQESHPDAAGNRLLEYARTIGRPLTKISDAVKKVVRMMSGRLAVIHTCNPAIFDIGLRRLAERFPKVFTPMLEDREEILRLGLPSEILVGAFIGWTAPGAPGFFDMWKKPAEFQSTLYAVRDSNRDIVTDDRLTENDIPHNLGQDVARSALDRAPPEQSLDRFPSLPQMNHVTITHEDSRVTQQFYGSRRDEVIEHIQELRASTRVSTEHEFKAIDRRALESPFEVGIEIHALLQEDDPTATTDEVLLGDHGTQGRDTVDVGLL